jgi:hypothetical protein
MNVRALALTGSVLLAMVADSAIGAVIPTFDLYTSSMFAGQGKVATCRVVNVGFSSIDVSAQLVDVNGDVLASGVLGVQAQHNGAVAARSFTEDSAGVYCRFNVSHVKQVRASLTLVDGFDSAATTVAVAEAR